MVVVTTPKLVRSFAEGDFVAKLHEAIVFYQSVGWNVEIHYQMDQGLYSALVVPRKEI